MDGLYVKFLPFTFGALVVELVVEVDLFNNSWGSVLLDIMNGIMF